MELDRLSSLPDDVTEKILSLLLPREAARTSVLSTKWRYKSALMLQALEFHDRLRSLGQNRVVDHYDGQTQTSFVNMVDHVLLLHIGPIRKFKLFSNVDELTTRRDIDRWVTHVSRNSIKELILFLWDSGYKIPSCVFSCQDLVRLEFTQCILKPPSTFKGFKSLKSLRLVFVDMDQDVFETVIRSSPLLERLTLKFCKGFTILKINAPNLKYMHVLGTFDVINLESAFNITEAEVGVRIHAESADQRWVPDSWEPSSSSNLLKIFDHLPHIQRLEIKWDFLKYLSSGALPEKLPNPCQYLKVLSMDISFDDRDAILTALCILRSSPALQELEFVTDGIYKFTRRHAVVEEQKASWSEVSYNFTLAQLRLVKISEISGVKAELDFIRFLLISSPLLERMTVRPPQYPELISVDGFSKLVRELLQLQRESKHAEIIFLDP